MAGIDAESLKLGRYVYHFMLRFKQFTDRNTALLFLPRFLRSYDV
jgi:hypothetical protein